MPTQKYMFFTFSFSKNSHFMLFIAVLFIYLLFIQPSTTGALLPQTLVRRRASNPILTKGIWGGVCWEIHKFSLFYEFRKLVFFFSCWVILRITLYRGEAEETVGEPNQEDNASSEVHLTSEFPVMLANNFLYV